MQYDAEGLLSEEHLAKSGKLKVHNIAYEDRPVERIERLLVVDSDAKRIHESRVKEHMISVDFASLLGDGEEVLTSLK